MVSDLACSWTPVTLYALPTALPSSHTLQVLLCGSEKATPSFIYQSLPDCSSALLEFSSFIYLANPTYP